VHVPLRPPHRLQDALAHARSLCAARAAAGAPGAAFTALADAWAQHAAAAAPEAAPAAAATAAADDASAAPAPLVSSLCRLAPPPADGAAAAAATRGFACFSLWDTDAEVWALLRARAGVHKLRRDKPSTSAIGNWRVCVCALAVARACVLCCSRPAD
jgi:hypothetical protein